MASVQSKRESMWWPRHQFLSFDSFSPRCLDKAQTLFLWLVGILDAVVSPKCDLFCTTTLDSSFRRNRHHSLIPYSLPQTPSPRFRYDTGLSVGRSFIRVAVSPRLDPGLSSSSSPSLAPLPHRLVPLPRPPSQYFRLAIFLYPHSHPSCYLSPSLSASSRLQSCSRSF